MQSPIRLKLNDPPRFLNFALIRLLYYHLCSLSLLLLTLFCFDGWVLYLALSVWLLIAYRELKVFWPLGHFIKQHQQVMHLLYQNKRWYLFAQAEEDKASDQAPRLLTDCQLLWRSDVALLLYLANLPPSD